jgi:hypothetical protein
MSADDFIFFEDEPNPGRKTRVVLVRNRRSGEELGKVRWYGAWRQYCFYPASLTIFNITCMARIGDEMLGMTLAHREGL